ncbi:MAG TPA: hypothetical protein VFS31_16585 [Chitinophagaceae bacterium]|nr:hypothetical protein [Chitinophagaceae bacterium]
MKKDVKEIRVFNWSNFFLLEEENNLFAVKNKQGIYIWDIIRYEVYFSLLRDQLVTADGLQKKNIGKYLNVVKDLLALAGFILFGKRKYFFLSLARNKDNEGRAYDQNIDDVLSELHQDAFILETFDGDKHNCKYKHFVYNRIVLLKKIIMPLLKTEDYTAIIKLVKERFGKCLLTNQDINRLIKSFRIEYAYYRFLLKTKKIKAAFITQNGIQKGLFAAAHDLQVPIVEFQHGLIEPEHIAYSYSKEINYEQGQIHLPDYFFSFAEYWGKTVYLPVKEIIPIGNTAFSRRSYTEAPAGNAIVVASANVYGEDLKKLVLDFVAFDQETLVYFKLHPNQFNEYDYYCSEFSSYKNVQVIRGERTMQQLIAATKAVLIIKSTAIYEALHAERIGIVYQKQKKLPADPILNFPNVYVVSNAVELSAALNNRFIGGKATADIFFKAFDKELFLGFMKHINS